MGAKKNKNTKRKRSGMKEKVHQVNPFELKINRQKFDILGRKVSKTEKGMPGVSRSKALKKRKETLLVEYRKLGRGNKFVDKRIGERDATMSYDEKMAKRFALERQRELEKMHSKNLLNASDDDQSEEEIEELTHFGQSLSEMENFKDPVISDVDDDDSDDGRINAKVVGEEHFGGFLTKRSSDNTEENEKPKSWKERMEEVIARSKLAKLERQNEREKTLAAVKNVDSEWKELQMLMSAIQRNRENEKAKPKDGDYDVVMRQLQFDLKAKPTDRLKSEEEIAKEEKERLEELEADRVRRMLGHPDDADRKKVKSMSADDLDDGLAFYSIKDGNSADDADGNSDNDEDGADAGGADNADDSNENDESDDDGEDDDDDNDSLSDVESSGSESQESDVALPPTKKRVRFVNGDVTASAELSVGLKLTKEEIVAATKELPYTFSAPANYSELTELVANRSDGDSLTIIDRVIKCHHPSLAEGNKAKLEIVCRLLLRYFSEVTRRETVSHQLLDGLTKYIYNLTQSAPSAAGEELMSILFELHKKSFDGSKQRRKKNSFPGFDVLLVFKLASVLFPTSDRRHPVITPAMLFMGRILTESPVSSTMDIAAGLFLCTLFADYIGLSKRYIPEVIRFLESVLMMSFVRREDRDVLKNQTSAQHKSLLQVSGDCSVDMGIEDLSITEVFANYDNDDYASADKFKLQLISQCLRLVIIFAEVYHDLPAFNEIFARIRNYGNCMPADTYPTAVKTLHSEMMQKVIRSHTYKPVVRPTSKPQSLKLLEPRIRENFDGRKKLPGTKAAREKAALKIKTKREFKGALREIRKDTQFIARQKLIDQTERDAERKRKVQKIISDLAIQEGECRALKKKM